MRLFLDANVVFSACLGETSRAHALFELAQAGRCRLLTSGYALAEARRNLARKAPHALGSLAELSPCLELIDVPSDMPSSWAEAEGLPSKDAPILAAAVAARVDLLVTGDRRHFGPLFGRTLRGVRVLPLVEGLAAVMDAAERNQN